MSIGVFESNDGETAAVTATGSNGSTGVAVGTDSGLGVFADSSTGVGVFATSSANIGVFASSLSSIAVHAVGGGAVGAAAFPVAQAAVLAEGGPGVGIYATSNTVAISGTSTGESPFGVDPGHIGVQGTCSDGTGVLGVSSTGIGVAAQTDSGIGVSATATTAEGVALQVAGRVQIQGNSVGTTTLAHGTKTVTVSNPAATADSLIFLTPLEDPQGFLWIGARSAGSFTIDASKAPSADVTIGFLIIN